jgi:AraC-like DNA-binding protein
MIKDHASDSTDDFVWSTGQGGVTREPDDFASKLTGEITPMAVTAQDRTSYAAEWRKFGLEHVALNFFTAEAQKVDHSPSMVKSQSKADYELLYMHHGIGHIRHSGSEMPIPEGSFVLVDNELPWHIEFRQETVCFTTHLHDEWLRKWVAYPKQLIARPIEARTSWGSPLASLLETISNRGLSDAILPRPVIADQIGAMIALLAGETGQAGGVYQMGLLSRAKRMLQDRYHEAELSPMDVANDMGISKRHLHGIFAQSGSTFGSVLLDIRMNRARELLTSKAFQTYRVGDVAWACGFADPSHFARRFRERFGCSPIDFRTRSI